MNGAWRGLICILALFVCLLLKDITVFAQGASSTYRIDESFIGPGSQLESGSTNYNLEAGQQSTGNTGVVEGISTNYKAQGGATTTSEPYLRCSVQANSLNFGAFSTASTSTATATFSVLNYTSYGYVVSIVGTPPRTGSHTLSALATNASSVVGTEQFGINLVANTAPTSFGAFPAQLPDSATSFGDATPQYSTPNTYRYVSGETVASAPKSSGQTNYTISYIVNISNTTAGGGYSGNQAILCTGTY